MHVTYMWLTLQVLAAYNYVDTSILAVCTLQCALVKYPYPPLMQTDLVSQCQLSVPSNPTEDIQDTLKNHYSDPNEGIEKYEHDVKSLSYYLWLTFREWGGADADCACQ